MLKPILLFFVLVWRSFVSCVVGLRAHEVRVVMRVWRPHAPDASGRINVGEYDESFKVLRPRPLVRFHANDRVSIEKITPKIGPFGSRPDDVVPPRKQGHETFVEIVGPLGRGRTSKRFGIESTDFANPIAYSLVVGDANSRPI